MYWIRSSMLMVMTMMGLNAAVVVVNSGVLDTTMTEERARDLLLGRITSWRSGDPVVIILCTDALGEQAVKEITGRSVNLLQRGWKRLVFSGSGAMPLQADSVATALNMVVKQPGAMVILNDVTKAESCRIIPVTPKTLTASSIDKK